MSRYNHQPTYDFLAGGAEPSPHRAHRPPPTQPIEQPFKQSTNTHANEDLRAQFRTLQYELDSLKQDRELSTLETQSELRDAQARAESEYKRALDAERAKTTAVKRAEALGREVQGLRDRAENEKSQSERKVRGLQEDCRGLREEVEECRAESEERNRGLSRQVAELEERFGRVRQEGEENGRDAAVKTEALLSAQKRLAESEAKVGQLENEVLKLKAQTGDVETLALVKKELSEQVEYIRRLESTTRDQSNELKKAKTMAKSVQVVEEEKRGLEGKLRIMEDLRRELAEAQLQRRILEDEKAGWTSYLQGSGGEVQFETPEQMAKAFLQERMERLSLVDRLGEVQPELHVKDEAIRALEDKMAKLQGELDAARAMASSAPVTTNAADAKARARLERQKILALKEVAYLRASLKAYEAEEAEFNAEQVDQAHAERISSLETLLQENRAELQALHDSLSTLETQRAPSQPASPRKRSREEVDAEDERLGALRRKLQTLQNELTASQTSHQNVVAELTATKSQLQSLRASNQTRTLELRSNPTAQQEAVKTETLNTLRAENAALLSQLEGEPGMKTVPRATLDSARLAHKELESTIAQLRKKELRLKTIFTQKSLEFREAVASILGWKLDFQPNGRVSCSPISYPKQIDPDTQEEVDNAITFDGEQGTMKVSGGPRSAFAREIGDAVEFWVGGRGSVPGLLAALTLEFYERQDNKKAREEGG